MLKGINEPHGRGILLTICGQIYEGFFKNGDLNGHYRLISNTLSLEGKFKGLDPIPTEIYTIHFLNSPAVFPSLS